MALLPARLPRTLRPDTESARRVIDAVRPLLPPVQLVLTRAGEFVTPQGRAVAACAAGAWLLGVRLGWIEFLYVSAACLSALTVALLFTIGRLHLAVSTKVAPARVLAGRTARAEVTVVNPGNRRALPCMVEVSVGAARPQFAVPSLRAGAELGELVEIPTSRRAIIPVGPARTLRQDPVGLLRRSLVWPEVAELFVHPLTIPIDGFGDGVLRDLEGRATDATSMSDIELHALREYVPGDDRRFVHWRSSARRTDGALMVRQFIDSRRSHLGVLLGARPEYYASEQEFELAISVLASVALRGIRDQQSTTVLALGRRLGTVTAQGLLDGTSGLAWDNRSEPLAATIRQLNRIAPDLTIAVIVSGSATPIADLRDAATRFPPGVHVIAIRVDPDAGPEFRPSGALSLLTVPELHDLPGLLRTAVRS